MPTETKCPICHSVKIEQFPLSGGRDMYRIRCSRCHEFICSFEFMYFGQTEQMREKMYLLSGLVRELNETA